MMAAFNPNRLGSSPQQTQVSFDDIARLKAGIGQGLNQFAEATNAMGQASRGNKVIEAIASGSLDGLSSADTQKKVLELSGGSVNADTQALINSLLQKKTGAESAQAEAQAQNALEMLKQSGDLNKQQLTNTGLIDVANIKEKGDLTLEQLRGQNALRSAQVGSNATLLAEQMRGKNKLAELEYANKLGISRDEAKAKIEALKTKDQDKLTETEKLVLNQYEGGFKNLNDPVQNTVEFYARSGENLLESQFGDMNDLDKKILTDVTTKVLSSPQGIIASKLGATAVKDQIDKELKTIVDKNAPFGYKLDYETSVTNLLPGGAKAAIPRLVPRTKNDK